MEVTNKMELLQLKYFYEVAKNEHVSKTAKQLHIAQPSLTQTIHRLETELGVKLFRSSGRNIVLTDCGKYLKERIEPVIEIIESIPSEIEEISNPAKHTITLNVMAASATVSDAIISYQNENEHIRFKIISSNATEKADIIVYTEPYYTGEKDDNTYIFTEKLFLAVPPDSNLAKCSEISLERTRNQEFISLAGSTSLRQICDRFCMQSGFVPKIIFESDSPSTVRNMIGANLGIGFWPQYTWGGLKEQSIKFLPIKSPVCRRDLIIKYNYSQYKRNNDEIKRFFDFLTAYFEKLRNQ
jgi:DNA-binding transcriptional LysR family regulator